MTRVGGTVKNGLAQGMGHTVERGMMVCPSACLFVTWHGIFGVWPLTTFTEPLQE